MPSKSADTRVLIEVCVDSVAGARAADRGGADRLELCANLVEGGTTPSAGMIQAVLDATQLPIMVMIRPRGGNFCYDRDELNTMQRELEAVLEHPVAGVVLGALTPDGRIDMNACQRLGRQTVGVSRTFHRAFDHTQDADAALQQLLDLPIDRLLTSGQRATAVEGIPLLRRLVEQSQDRIHIMPGAGIGPGNVRRILHETGAREIHLSGSHLVESPSHFRRPDVPMSAATTPGDNLRRVTCDSRIRAVREAVS
jgi:copper homeostasis protein